MTSRKLHDNYSSKFYDELVTAKTAAIDYASRRRISQ